MTQKTIKKVLDELGKITPDLSYIRGMLEVLVDEEQDTIKTPSTAVLMNPHMTVNQSSSDREQIGALIKEVSKYLTPEQSFQETIKKWLDVDAVPENFPEILQKLTVMKSTYESGVTKVDTTDAHSEMIINQK